MAECQLNLRIKPLRGEYGAPVPTPEQGEAMYRAAADEGFSPERVGPDIEVTATIAEVVNYLIRRPELNPEAGCWYFEPADPEIGAS